LTPSPKVLRGREGGEVDGESKKDGSGEESGKLDGSNEGNRSEDLKAMTFV